MAGPLAPGGTGAVLAGGHAGTVAAAAAGSRPSRPAAGTVAAATPAEVIRLLRVTGRRDEESLGGVEVDMRRPFRSCGSGEHAEQANMFTCASKYIGAV